MPAIIFDRYLFKSSRFLIVENWSEMSTISFDVKDDQRERFSIGAVKKSSRMISFLSCGNTVMIAMYGYSREWRGGATNSPTATCRWLFAASLFASRTNSPPNLNLFEYLEINFIDFNHFVGIPLNFDVFHQRVPKVKIGQVAPLGVPGDTYGDWYPYGSYSFQVYGVQMGLHWPDGRHNGRISKMLKRHNGCYTNTSVNISHRNDEPEDTTSTICAFRVENVTRDTEKTNSPLAYYSQRAFDDLLVTSIGLPAHDIERRCWRVGGGWLERQVFGNSSVPMSGEKLEVLQLRLLNIQHCQTWTHSSGWKETNARLWHR
ncbi:hypothetical protein ACFE04_019830 [Oxalis oulophora]